MIKIIFRHQVISILFSIFFSYFLNKSNLLNNDISSVIEVFIQVVAGLMGFLLAAVSLLFAYKETPQIKRLKQSIRFSDVYDSYFYAIYVCGAITVSGLVIGLFKKDKYDLLWTMYSISLATLSLSYLIRLTKKIMFLTK